nr:CoA transferase [Actinomycetota bacterium]
MTLQHPLSGIRVVEIGDRLAVAYCGKLLRDAGADVVKLERGQGDPWRQYRPVGAGMPKAHATSGFFGYLAGGKRSVVVSDASPLPDQLVASADIVVVAASPAEAGHLGVDVPALVAAAPKCVVVTVSSFGWTGPWVEYPATEFTLQGWCGSIGSRGVPERPPISAGGDLGEFIAGGYAAFFALAAHYGAVSGGPGSHVDLSVLEAMTSSMQTFGWLRKDVAGLQSFARTTEVPSIESAKDGYVGVSMATDQQWLDFCAMVDCPQLADIAEL